MQRISRGKKKNQLSDLMSISEIVFYSLSAVTLGSAVMVVLSKNPVHSVMWLIVTFFAISGHYILMNAQFLGIVNLIVYAGAIMVLFLFVIMLMNLGWKKLIPLALINMIITALVVLLKSNGWRF